MDASQALADLTEISSQIEHAAIVGPRGGILASTLDDASEFVAKARRLLDEADSVREARGLETLAQLEAATLEGSVFVVRDGGRMVVATTKPDPTVGLVFYDLKQCLRSIEATKKKAASKDADGAS